MSIEEYRLALQAEEAKKELGVLDAVKTEEESVINSPEVAEEKPQREFTALELEQMELGWNPDKEGGVSAAEFKRVGEIIEAKRRASKEAQLKSREVQELTQTVKQLVEHNKAMALASLKAKNEELARLKMEKIQEGDVEAVLRIEQEQKLHEAANMAENTVNNPPVVEESEDVKAFKVKYDQYLKGSSEEDIEIQSIVRGKVEYLMKTNPNIDEKVAIQQIEATLAKRFPEKFDLGNKQRASKVSASTVSGKSVKSDLSANMTLEEKYLFESIRSVDKTFTLDNFADMYLKHRK
jgi:hypothetical protein